MASMALMAAASCTQESLSESATEQEPAQEGAGTIVVNVRSGTPGTRADGPLSSYTEEQGYEKVINKVEIFVFDKATGDLNGYVNAGTETSASMNVTSGAKHVYAIVNSPVNLSAITEEAALNAVALKLDDNHTDLSKGFVMAGVNKDVTVTSGTAVKPTITVDRFTSRIALVKVTNNLPTAYGALTIEDVFLSNVVANQELGGTAEAGAWYNIMGRIKDATEATQIIGVGTNAGTCPDLTHKVAGLTVPNLVNEKNEANTKMPKYLFYAYPNSCAAADESVKWDTEGFPGDQTRLILTATVDGKYFYYPVIIDKLERNKSYDVSVKISGFGVTDPADEIEKGSIEVTVSANPWTMGEAIEEDL